MIENQEIRKPMLLPHNFTNCGYLLNQEYRGAWTAVYSVTDLRTGVQHGYEVFEIRVQVERITPNGIHFAHKEVYPSAEAFGVWAFAPSRMDRAVEIFLEMELKEVSKFIELSDTPQQIAKNLVRDNL